MIHGIRVTENPERIRMANPGVTLLGWIFVVVVK